MTEEPDVIAPAGPPHTYLGVADSLLPGAIVLANATPAAGTARSLVAAHALECLLKAYLSRGGCDARLRKKAIRHNLSKLWAMAHAEGLSISAAPPAWAQCLSRLHNEPYYLRYSEGVHAIVLPAAQPMTSELQTLIELVRKQIT